MDKNIMRSFVMIKGYDVTINIRTALIGFS